MKLGIFGLPGSGQTTVFRALTGGVEAADRHGRQEAVVGVVMVRDERLDHLVQYYETKKVTPVHVEYLDMPGITGEGKPAASLSDKALVLIRPLDALIHCVRFFDSPAHGAAEPLRDYQAAMDDVILSDLAIVEKRLERIEKDVRKGRKDLAEEVELLRECHAALDGGRPLRLVPQAAESEKLKGFAFLTVKPQLILLNAGENRSRQEIAGVVADLERQVAGQGLVMVDWLYADTEAEIARLSEEDAREFLQELNIEEGARDRIVRKSFELLNLIVFFTAAENEVRAWPLTKGFTALKAAGTVHSDMERGFIRAEVIAFDDFKAAGSMTATHKTGKARLEGRDYVVNDGDIILFRFNV